MITVYEAKTKCGEAKALLGLAAEATKTYFFVGFSVFGEAQTLLKRAYRLIGRFITYVTEITEHLV